MFLISYMGWLIFISCLISGWLVIAFLLLLFALVLMGWFSFYEICCLHLLFLLHPLLFCLFR